MDLLLDYFEQKGEVFILSWWHSDGPYATSNFLSTACTTEERTAALTTFAIEVDEHNKM